MNTTTAIFNTTVKQMTEMSQPKKTPKQYHNECPTP